MRLIRLFAIIISLILLTTSLIVSMSRRGALENEWIIVFTRGVRDKWLLVNILPNGEVVERPTFLRGELHWSSDNEWVAYVDMSRIDERPLYRARPNGRNRRLLLENTGMLSNLNWSPDSEWLYFTSGPSTPTRDLFRIHAQNASQEQFGLWDNPHCCQWSSDGEWMLIDRGDRLERALPDGSIFQEIVSMEGFDVGYPQFAANDQVIVFSANQVPRTNIIYKATVDGDNVEQISHTDYSFLPAVSPNRKQVAFLATQLDTFLTHLYTIELDDPVPQVLTELTDYFYEYNPFVSNLMWSPDGKSIIFLAQHDGQQGLFQVSAAGGAVETLYTVPDGKATRPHFLEFPHKGFAGWGFVAASAGLMIASLWLYLRSMP